VFVIYLIFIVLVEGTYCGYPQNKTSLDNRYKIQQIVLREHHGQPIPEELKAGISEQEIAAAKAAMATEAQHEE
jgi:hypothetical protein